MINVLFTQKHLPEAGNESVYDELRRVASWVAPLPETQMIGDRLFIQGIVESIEDVETIKAMLNSMNLAPKIVWVGDIKTGLQLGTEKVNIGTDENPSYEIQGTATYPFDLTEYTAFLREVVDTYSPEGDILTSHKATEQEAQSIQVNKYAGMPDRDLIVR